MPVHWVEFRRGFWIAATEITNAQYERFDSKHERSEYSQGDDTPIAEVSWEDAKKYCAWLSENSGRPIRLPSEAEWECTCRAGSDDEFTFGDAEARLSEYAWYDEISGRAHAVATKRPNRWGLSDLHGNIWEWCEDTYHGSYKDAPADGSAWTEGGVEWEPGTPRRVLRGGGWSRPSVGCRSAVRHGDHPAFSVWILGFRPAFSSPDD
jgi:formylglycine-generating enzyme required for sulfatase activity